MLEALWKRYVERCGRAGRPPTESAILVSTEGACQYHFSGGRLLAAYLSSAGRAGLSEVENSGGTPRGLHEVAEKHGEGVQLGGVLKSRVDSGRHWREFPGEVEGRVENLVTTRLLWLRGLEPGFNAGPGVDTFGRYIYIHGTNHPELLGRPLSGGCVVLRDEEVVVLYEAVPVGTQVYVE